MISYAVFCLKKFFLMIRRPPRSTLSPSSAASDVYKRQMNEVYATFFTSDPPARSAVQVGKLPKDAMVEIEAIAVR